MHMITYTNFTNAVHVVIGTVMTTDSRAVLDTCNYSQIASETMQNTLNRRRHGRISDCNTTTTRC